MAIDANKLLSFRAASEVAIIVSSRIVSPVIFQDFLPVLRVSPHPFGVPLLARIGVLHTVLLAAVLAVAVKTVSSCLVAVELRLRKLLTAMAASLHVAPPPLSDIRHICRCSRTSPDHTI